MITISDKNKNGAEELHVINYLPLYEMYDDLHGAHIAPPTIYNALDNMRKCDDCLNCNIEDFESEKIEYRSGNEIIPTPINVKSTENNTLIVPILLGMRGDEDRRTCVSLSEVSGEKGRLKQNEVRNAWPTLAKASMGIVTNAYKLPISIAVHLSPVCQTMDGDSIPHLDDMVFFQKNYALALAEIMDHFNELVMDSEIPNQPRIVFVIRDSSYPLKDHEKLVRATLGILYHYIETMSHNTTHIVEAYCIRIHDIEQHNRIEKMHKKERKEKKKLRKLLKKAEAKNKK